MIDNIIKFEPLSDRKRSPLVWMGNKSLFVEQLTMAIPGDADFFIDAFAGGGSLSFHLLRQDRFNPSQMVMNDLNTGLIDFYCNIQSEKRNGFITELLEIHSGNVGKNKSLFDKHRKLKFESGLSFYIHNRLSFNGQQGESLKWCKSEQRASTSFTRPEIRKLETFGKWLVSVDIRLGDYHDLILPTDKAFIYADPTYGMRNGARDKEFYGFDFDQQRHVEWCNGWKDKCYGMICHADTLKVIAMFKGWHIYRVPKSGDGAETELVITNYEIPFRSFYFLREDYGWQYIGVPEVEEAA